WHVGAAAARKPDTTTWDIEGTLERGRLAVRAEYLWRHRAAAAVTTRGWYALAAYALQLKRLQLVGRVQQYDPNDAAGGDRTTGYTGGAQYFSTGDDLKLQVEYTVFVDQSAAVANNRRIAQMQGRRRRRAEMAGKGGGREGV